MMWHFVIFLLPDSIQLQVWASCCCSSFYHWTWGYCSYFICNSCSFYRVISTCDASVKDALSSTAITTVIPCPHSFIHLNQKILIIANKKQSLLVVSSKVWNFSHRFVLAVLFGRGSQSLFFFLNAVTRTGA